jgi:hypothetical protein
MNEEGRDDKTIDVMVNVDEIKNGHLLLGRFNKDANTLTAITVIDSRAKVPQDTELTRYELLGMTDEGIHGQPLNEFVEENCSDRNGTSPITLYFNAKDAKFVRWAYSAQAASAT